MIYKIRLLFGVLFVPVYSSLHAQDSCVVSNCFKYEEFTARVTKCYYENGLLNEKHIKNWFSDKQYVWNSCGQLISKTYRQKSIRKGRRRFGRNYTKSHRFDYYSDGTLKFERFVKTYGCHRIKKSWVKNYTQDGRRIKHDDVLFQKSEF